MRKRILAVMLTAFIFVGLSTSIIPVWATEPEVVDKDIISVWDGVVADKFAGGSGTAEDPYQITNGGHLALIGEAINWAEDLVTLKGVYFKVMNDIDMNGKPIEPIGGYYDDVYFSGYFDGNGKTISNINLKSYLVDGYQMNVGLFGCVRDAVIRNVVIENLCQTDGVTAKTKSNVGALVGKAIDSQIINCHVRSDLVFECCRPESLPSLYAGSLVGVLQDGCVVKGCTYKGTLQANGRGDNEVYSTHVATFAGGLIGCIDGKIVNANTSAIIEDCIVDGTMFGTGKTYNMSWGGVVGIAYYGVINTEKPIMNNILSTVTVDVDGVDMSVTYPAYQYMNFGGIISGTGSFSMALENVHYYGDPSSVVAANGNNILKTKVAGIVTDPSTESTYKKVTTSFDKVTINAVEFTDDVNSTIMYEENWKGQWDRETCFVNVFSDTNLIRQEIEANIANINSYDDGYDLERDSDLDLFHTHQYIYGKHNSTEHKYYCVCGEDEYYEEHTWDKTVISEPTDTEDGVILYTCTQCGESKYERERKHEHEYVNFTQYDEESHVGECSCGKTEHLPHEWRDTPVVDASTFETEIKQVCKYCGLRKESNGENKENNKSDVKDSAENKSDNKKDDEEENGCNSEIGLSGVVIVASFGVSAAMIGKKKDE